MNLIPTFDEQIHLRSYVWQFLVVPLVKVINKRILDHFDLQKASYKIMFNPMRLYCISTPYRRTTNNHVKIHLSKPFYFVRNKTVIK